MGDGVVGNVEAGRVAVEVYATPVPGPGPTDELGHAGEVVRADQHVHLGSAVEVRGTFELRDTPAHTHDEAIIARARQYAREANVATDRFEFQMLYGVRRDLQERLVREGYRMRVYVPYGTQWYPYLMRRLAERPANMAFMTGNIIKEMVGKRR